MNVRPIILLGVLALAACARREGNAGADSAAARSKDEARALAERAAEGPRDDELRSPDSGATPPAAVGGGPADRSRAREEIARARCEHLQRCGAIGDGTSFDSASSCLVASRVAVELDLAEDTCRSVNTGAVRACARAWRAQTCGAQLDVQPEACVPAALCAQ